MNSAPLTGPLDAPTVPQHRQGADADGRQHPDRDEGEGAGPDRLLRRRRRRRARRSLPPLLRQPGGGRTTTRRRRPRGRGNGGRRRQREQTTRAAGTGFIISKDGYILTNNHVVEDATKIEVSLYADDADVSYTAKVIGRDPLTDSALIQLIDKPNHAAAGGEVRRLVADGGRRLGDGDRQPVRLRAHGDASA